MSVAAVAIYLINTLSAIKDSAVFLCEAVYDAYQPKSWAFTTRNAYPTIVNSRWSIDPSIDTYSPDTYSFGQSTSDSKSIDIVTAQIEAANKTTFDMSSFLYSVRWYDSPPSLYELVILYFLHQKICLSTDLIDTYTFTALTSEGEDITIQLGSASAKKPFRGWNTELKVD